MREKIYGKSPADAPTDLINEQVARKLGRLGEPPDSLHWSWDGAVLPRTINPIPDYCSSIAAAWEIIDHLKTQSNTNQIMLDWDGENWNFTILGDPEQGLTFIAHTAPMAIVLAFLKLENQR